LFLRRGIDLRTVAEGTKGGVFSRSISRYLEKFATQGPRSVYPLSEAANRVGLDVSTLRRFHEVLGEPGEYLDEQ
jgi:hypothetical protein